MRFKSVLFLYCYLVVVAVNKASMAGALAGARLNFSQSPYRREKPLCAAGMPQQTQTQGKHIQGPAKSAEILAPCRPSPHLLYTYTQRRYITE